MDFSWLGVKSFYFLIRKSNSGQSTVEYILLFAVVASFMSLVFKSDEFNKYFGQEGVISTTLRYELEYSYRHARGGSQGYSKPSYNGGSHESYNGRFFGAADPYP